MDADVGRYAASISNALPLVRTTCWPAPSGIHKSSTVAVTVVLSTLDPPDTFTVRRGAVANDLGSFDQKRVDDLLYRRAAHHRTK